MADASPPPEPRNAESRGPDRPGLVARTRSRATGTWSRVEGARPRIPALDAAFDIRDYDQEVAGGLLAGAIAFRLFLWLVPFALVLVTAAGWIAQGTQLSSDELADRYGVTGIVARYVGDASQQSSTSRLFLLAVGFYAMYLASLSTVRALRVAHVLAWRMPATHLTGSFAAALWFAAGATALVLVAGAINNARRSLPGPGLAMVVLMAVGIGAIWLWASWRLPHPPEVPLEALVPGAILFAVGAGALHIATVLWYGHRIAHRSELYGGLGTAVGLLAWLYLLGRLAISSAVVNASLWRRRRSKGAVVPTSEAPG